MKNWKKILILFVAFGLGMIFQIGINQQLEIKNKSEYETVMEYILKYHSTDKVIEREKLEEVAIRAMVESLDDEHTVYLNKKEYDKFKDDSAGNVSIGIKNNSKNMGEGILIWTVFKNSPANKSGLVAGDIITKINGKDIINVEDEKIAPLMMGKEGSSIDLEIIRPATGETINFNITREKGSIEMIDYAMLNDEIGYISVLQVNKGLDKEFKKVLEDLIAKGMKKLILDLRGNPGGEVETALRIEGMFLDDEVKEIGKYINKRSGEEMNLLNIKNELFNGEMIVLVNEKSASASELMADTLCELKRAKIIGEKTFGKGSMQHVFELANGKKALKLTSANYQRADGTYIDGIGVSPDIEVKQDRILNSTGYISENKERREIRLANIESALVKKYGAKTAKEMIENGDLQLKRAIEELSR